MLPYATAQPADAESGKTDGHRARSPSDLRNVSRRIELCYSLHRAAVRVLPTDLMKPLRQHPTVALLQDLMKHPAWPDDLAEATRRIDEHDCLSRQFLRCPGARG